MHLNFRYSPEKNAVLLKERGIGFEEIIKFIAEGNLLEIRRHHNQIDYPNQKIMYIKVVDFVYAVPYVEESDGTLFLKTLFPSRKATKYFLNNSL